MLAGRNTLKQIAQMNHTDESIARIALCIVNYIRVTVSIVTAGVVTQRTS